MDISTLNLFGPKEKQLRAKGFNTVEDLYLNFPRRYEDFTQPLKLEQQISDVKLTGAFVITGWNLKPSDESSKYKYVQMYGEDAETGVKVMVFWMGQQMSFKPEFMYFASGQKYVVCGTATYKTEWKSYTISNPSIFCPYGEEVFCLNPIYTAIRGMAADYYKNQVLPKVFALPHLCDEPYPPMLATQYGWPNLETAIREVHRPQSAASLRCAQDRLIFDNLFRFSLQLQYSHTFQSDGSQYNLCSMSLVNRIKARLPYELTPDQNSILEDAFAKMRSGRRLNALIQGDVGSGKTIVAALLMAAMVDSGHQCAIMAPSKVLAQQHYNDFVSLFGDDAKVMLCLGASQMRKSDREMIASGKVQIFVGTHALTYSSVRFHDLALIIVDEEHKFGVARRQAISEKASTGVHTVTMSATPIPRTLASVIYGNSVSLYTIKTMPKGRTPVQTFIRPSSAAEKVVYPAVERQLKEGHQAFVVCPTVDSSENYDGISVAEVSEAYRKYFEPLGYKVATLTGKDTKEVMEETLTAFVNGEYQILVATTVIEVGVNIPNATVMVVHDADYFGLSSLHQLRGRVGRSSFPSYCVLVSSKTDNTRLQIMKTTASGFEIAKADLELRGPGDLLGKLQKGQSEPVELMLAYPGIYEIAQREAAAALARGNDWPIVRAAKNAALVERTPEPAKKMSAGERSSKRGKNTKTGVQTDS